MISRLLLVGLIVFEAHGHGGHDHDHAGHDHDHAGHDHSHGHKHSPNKKLSRNHSPSQSLLKLASAATDDVAAVKSVGLRRLLYFDTMHLVDLVSSTSSISADYSPRSYPTRPDPTPPPPNRKILAAGLGDLNVRHATNGQSPLMAASLAGNAGIVKVGIAATLSLGNYFEA